MIRDPGPIHNLGYSVTSRDIPPLEGEERGDSPNSGYIAKALNGHPVLRFIASAGGSMATMMVLSRMTKSGGLKLGKYLQDSAQAAEQAGRETLTTRAYSSLRIARRELDELAGLNRTIGGVDENQLDPYSKLIFETSEGKLTTGDVRLTDRGTHFRGGELRQAGAGITNEPAAVWAYRDELQSKMVRLGRRLPYELPALYIGQRFITDPITGANSDKPKVKWYNPADVITDFVKQSAINTVTMLAPFEAAGAGINSAKSSLHTFRYSIGDLNRSMPSAARSRAEKLFVNLSDLTEAIGHDLGKLTNSIIKTSTRTSGALQAATKQYQTEQPNLVQSWHQIRNTRAVENYKNSTQASKIKKAGKFATDFLFGDNSTGNMGAIDIFPGLRGINSAIRQGINEYKNLGKGYDVVSGAVSFDRAVLGMGLDDANLARQTLRSSIGKIQDMRLDKMSRLANKVSVSGAGRTGADKFTTSDFYRMRSKDAYKDLLEAQLLAKAGPLGASDDFKAATRNFINNINVEPKISYAGRTITIGDSKIIKEGDDAYNAIIKRFATISDEASITNIFNSDVLDEAIKSANRRFVSREFQLKLNKETRSAWDTLNAEAVTRAGQTILKPKKANYQNFLNITDESSSEYRFLVEKSAQVLGINLKDAQGRVLSTSVIANKLGAYGLDAQDYGGLRSFLVREKKMSTGIFRGEYNIFGLKQLTIDEAVGRGMYAHLGQDKENIIRATSARIAARDPISSTEGISVLSGMYTTSSGLNIDLSALKSIAGSIGNFLAKDIKIPIVNFNPATLFGKGSFDEMTGRAPFQLVSGRTVQPFLGADDAAKDFYVFYSGGGSKGNVIGFSKDAMTGKFSSEVMSGQYRPIVTSSNEMFARNARIAAAKRIENKNLLNFENNLDEFQASPLLERFGFSRDAQIGIRRKIAGLKDTFNMAVDQPESMPALFSRFRNRSTDIYNPAVFNRLMEGQIVQTRKGAMRLNIADDVTNVVDDATGAQMVSQADFLRAFEINRRRIYGYGFDLKAMRALEENPLFRFGSTRLSDPGTTLSQKTEIANRLIAMSQSDARAMRALGLDSQAYLQSTNTIRKILEQSDLLSGTQIKSRSPSIITREDLLTNELFKQITLRNSLLTSNQDDAYIQIQNTLRDLYSSKQIGANALAESQAAGMGLLYKISSFQANRSSLSELAVQRRAAENVYSAMTAGGAAGDALKAFNQPFVNGSIARVGTKRFGIVRDIMYKRFSSAPHQLSDLTTDPLGSARGAGTDVTLVPTFGTVFARNPVQATLSVTGFNTYSNPEAYSGSSVPVSHVVERLNRYFGAAGLKIDPTQYSGPMSLFANGMIGRRVLPMYAAGTAAMTIDRTIGGFVNERDDRGEKVYSPFFVGMAGRGIVEAQAFGAGIVPGGMTVQEKREQLLEGEVPIRQGRFWPLGNTPFQGGKIMYYRPSWYRKLQGGAMFTSDTYGSPMEKALFHTDISPLRPFDPYRFERQHYEDRPYPITGEYFSGPFGPLVPLLNATVGKVLKPQVLMHEQQLSEGLASYVPAGQSGAYNAQPYVAAGISYGSGGIQRQPFGITGAGSFGNYSNYISNANARAASAAGSLNTASNLVTSSIGSANAAYAGLANGGFASPPIAFGPPKVSGVMPQRIVPAGAPISPDMANFQLGEIGYRFQETMGIYGFGMASLREKFGFGQGDFEPQRSVLQSASKAYGTSRQFWDLNLGGLGDLPLPGRSALSNIEFSEITRRFIPKERTGVDYLNPIMNTMGTQYPFLPGSEYFTDFTRGDPFTRIQEGEIRLPGVAYERFNKLRSDETGRYGLLDQYKILGDVASYSKQFKLLDKQLSKSLTDPSERILFEQMQARVASTQQKESFSDYKYRYSSAEEQGMSQSTFQIARMGEYLAHKDNIINTKFLNKHTAVEDWERRNVYGATFPEWQRPFESYIEPMFYKASNRDPLTAASSMAVAGSFFGATARGKAVTTISGALSGLVTSGYQNIKEQITGEEYIPLTRKKEMALEEYSDVLSYVKNKRLSSMAYRAGDAGAANQFRMAAERTMYGANLSNPDLETLSLAIPKRKREHFKAMINAPVEEREQILKTAPRLERRFYQAAWGMKVEQRPELDEYFASHELPGPEWEGWHPNTNMDHVKIKMGQSMGLEMSQMGYYPQQIREANLTNPSYPRFGLNSQVSTMDRIRSLMSGLGINGSVSAVNNYSGNENIDVLAGIR